MMALSPFQLSLIVLLSVGSVLGPAPGASVGALFVFFAYLIADKYFHNSFHDESKQAITSLKTELARLKAKQDQIDAKVAFGGLKNG